MKHTYAPQQSCLLYNHLHGRESTHWLMQSKFGSTITSLLGMIESPYAKRRVPLLKGLQHQERAFIALWDPQSQLDLASNHPE